MHDGFSNWKSDSHQRLLRGIVSATISYTVPWKIFVVACVGIFEKEYQSAYWIVGARITPWLDSKSGSCDVYCYHNDIEETTCLHRPSINPLVLQHRTSQRSADRELCVRRNSKLLGGLAFSRKRLTHPRLFNWKFNSKYYVVKLQRDIFVIKRTLSG